MDSSLFEEIGWYLFENKKYKESLDCFRRRAELYPDDLNMLISMTHPYLYNNDFKSAIAIHNAHLKDFFIPECSWGNMLQNDLIYLKEHHYQVGMFDQVFAIKRSTDHAELP